MKKIYIAIIVLLFSFSLSSGQDMVELVTNGSFDNSLSGWTFSNLTPSIGATCELDQNSVISGLNSAKVHMDTCAGGSPSGKVAIYTQLAIEEGKEYHISFKIKATKATSDWDLYWVFYDSVETGDYYAPESWSVATWSMVKDSIYTFELNYTPDFTDPDAYFSIDFGYMKTGPIDFWVDDISLTTEKVNEIVGQWDFEDSNDFGKATTGEDLLVIGSPTAVAGPKNGDGAALVGVDDYFKVLTNIMHSGSGNYINTYTILYDFKMDALDWNSFLQTKFDPSWDGQLFVTSNGRIGKGTYSTPGDVVAGEWYRMIMVIEEDSNSGTDSINMYLNGSSVLKFEPQSIDNRFALRDSIYLMSDNNGERLSTDIAKIVLYNYALTNEEIADLGGAGEIPTAVSAEKEISLNSYKLDQNYPNPFNPTTNINFSIPVAGKTTLSVYNVLGQKVATLVNQDLSAGSYSYNFNAANLSSGIYIYQLESNNHLEIKKMMLIK